MSGFKMRIGVMSAVLAGLIVLMPAANVRAAWKEPADKKFTEEMLKRYLDTADDWMKEVVTIADNVANAKTPVDRIAAVSDIDAKLQAVLDKHKESKEEYNWMQNAAIEAWVVVVTDSAFDQQETDLQKQFKDQDDKLADAQKRLAAFQAAQKNGTRVMSQQDHDAAVQSAKDDQKAALDDAKEHTDEAKAALDEAKQHDDEAKAAAALAANPPADVSDDDKPGYIEGKKNDAQAATDAAKDARDQAAAANKAAADATVLAAADGAKAEHPEIPVTDDEKAQVKSDNEAGITQAQADIDQVKQGKVVMAQLESQMKTTEDTIAKQAPTENVALLKKYQDQFKDIYTKYQKNASIATPAR